MTTLTASSQLTDGCDVAMANAIDRLIRISTAVAVLAVASVAAYVSTARHAVVDLASGLTAGWNQPRSMAWSTPLAW
jgi:hypothetical protein